MNIRKYASFLAISLAIPAASFSAVNFFDPANPSAVPATLSATGVYSNISTKTPDTSMKYFEVNAPLWSDGAAKKRWVILPAGTHVAYVDTTDAFNYPNHTMFVKNFYQDTVSNDSTSRKYWETRILVNKEDGDGNDFWYGFSYKWNAAGTEAYYVGSDGLDTLTYYYPKGLGQAQSYKKWSYPSAYACNQCHRTGTSDGVTTRGVLGFFPAQLKRPSPANASIHQIDALFSAGVFTGTAPNSTEKLARWKGLTEAIPTGITPAQRFAIIDTMARSYIGANCSGCHGTRNINVSGSAPFDLNYDYFRMRPVIEFGAQGVGDPGIGNADEDTTGSLLDGRHKFIVSILKTGLNSTGLAPWQVGFPALGTPTTLISAGFPLYSPMLYRQFALRLPAWRDSLKMVEALKESDPYNRKAWIFVNPWGSAAWRNDLASHTPPVALSEVVQYGTDGTQMPPLATYIPDTSAVKILGEWVRTYRTLIKVTADSIVNVNGRKILVTSESPRVQNRLLVVPSGWSGKAEMFSISGRAYALPSAGKGQYVIPSAVPSGLYFFKVGEKSFRASVLR